MKSIVFSVVITTVIALLLLITIYISNNTVRVNWGILGFANEEVNPNPATSTPSLPEPKTPTKDDNTSATTVARQAETTLVAGLYSGPFNLLVTEPQVGVVHIVGTGQFGGYSNQHSTTFDAAMSLINKVATYNTKNSDGSACQLQFRFNDSELNVIQIDECDVELAVFAKGRLNEEIQYRKGSN